MEIRPPAVYRDGDLALYLSLRVLLRIAVLVQSVALGWLGWHVYDLTRSPLALGIVGLIEFVPMFLLALPAGELADRFDPRRIIALAGLLEATSSALLLAFVLTHQRTVAALFGTIPAVVLGGLGTLAVVAIWMRAFPPLRTVDRMRDVMRQGDALSPEAG